MAACLFQDWFSRLSLKESSQAIDEKPCLRMAEYTAHARYLQLENLLAGQVIFLLCNPEALDPSQLRFPECRCIRSRATAVLGPPLTLAKVRKPWRMGL